MQHKTRCTPLCPFGAFQCLKRALHYRRRGNWVVAICTWTGDECIGHKCQFVSCRRHALMPDGTCRLILNKIQSRKRRRSVSIEEEALKMEKEVYGKLRDQLRKLGTDIERLE